MIASALASSQFTEEVKLRKRPLATVIRPVDRNVLRPALRRVHQSRSVLEMFLLLVEVLVSTMMERLSAEPIALPMLAPLMYGMVSRI